jgi:hypothetical protein
MLKPVGIELIEAPPNELSWEMTCVVTLIPWTVT